MSRGTKKAPCLAAGGWSEEQGAEPHSSSGISNGVSVPSGWTTNHRESQGGGGMRRFYESVGLNCQPRFIAKSRSRFEMVFRCPFVFPLKLTDTCSGTPCPSASTDRDSATHSATATPKTPADFSCRAWVKRLHDASARMRSPSSNESRSSSFGVGRKAWLLGQSPSRKAG